MLFFATAINYVDRQILSLIKEILDKELGWTNERFGMVNAAFQAAYGIGLLGFGWFIDRFGTKIGYAVSIAAWSVAAVGHSLVGSAGLFQRTHCPWAGRGGKFSGGDQVGRTVVSQTRTRLCHEYLQLRRQRRGNRRACDHSVDRADLGLACCVRRRRHGGLCVAAVLAAILQCAGEDQEPQSTGTRHIRSDADSGDFQAKVPWLSLLRYPQTWSFIVAKFLTDPVWWFFLIWLPDFFKKTRGLDIKKSWLHIVTIYAIVTVLSIFGGWVTGYLARCGWTVTQAQNGDVRLRTLRVADPHGHERRRLDGGANYRHRRRGAPGVVGEFVHDYVGHVPT